MPWDDIGLEVCTTHRPWPATSGARLAGVSAFGITGTNAHVVLEAARPVAAVEPHPDGAATLLTISANDTDALRSLAGSYRGLLAAGTATLAEVVRGGGHPSHTVTAPVGDRGGRPGIGRRSTGGGRTRRRPPGGDDGGVRPDPARVVFVFPGQGSQWVGMARELLADDATFALAMARVDAAIDAETGWSPLELLAGDSARLDDIDVVQPLLFAVQVALAARWQAWGVHPAAVIGHSMGEVAAAHVAGALGLADAVAVICRRSTLLARISGRGAMAVVDLPADVVEAALADRADVVSVAVSNSPRSTVISGDVAAVDELLARFTSDDVFCRRVNVDVASHSPQVDPLLDDLRAGLGDITPLTGTIPFDSTVDGMIVGGTALDADYWARNLRRPVRFGDAVARQIDAGATAFVEISPHPVLLPAIDHVLAGSDAPGPARGVPSLRRGAPERATLLAGLGALWVDGVDIDWPAVVGPEGRAVELPSYPWQRQRYWYDPPTRHAAFAGDHPLLGHRTALATSPGTVLWQTEPGRGPTAYLLDHVVRSAAIMPATGFVEQVRSAVAAERGDDAVTITDLRLVEPLPLDGRPVQVVLEAEGGGRWRCRVLAADPAGPADPVDGGPWRLHADAVAVGGPLAAAPSAGADDLLALRGRLLGAPDGTGHDDAMRARGLEYGPRFRTVRAWQTGPGEAVGHLDASDGRDAPERMVRLLDGALQLAIDALPPETSGRTFVPVGAGRIELHGVAGPEAWVHATLVSAADLACDITVLDAAGGALVTARDVRFVGVGGSAAASELDYEVRWEPAGPLDSRRDEPERTWVVYAADAVGEDVATRLRAEGRRCLVVTPGDAFATVSPDRYVVTADAVEDHARVLPRRRRVPGRRGPRRRVAELDRRPVRRCRRPGRAARRRRPDRRAPGPRRRHGRPVVDRDARGATGGSGAGGRRAGDGVGPGACRRRRAAGAAMHAGRPRSRRRRRRRASDLVAELLAGDDRQVALRDGERRVARLVHAGPSASSSAARTIETDAYRLAPTTPGSLDGVLPVVVGRRAPGPDEIEVRVEAAGVNFLDVLKAMGVCPGVEPSPDVALGAECSGRVVAVGAGVSTFAVGDDVIAMTPAYHEVSMLAGHVTLPAELAVPRPPSLDAVAASALPVAYVTASYALRDLARVVRGERVLVHSASGGVGLAAIEVCRLLGAEVIATAGSAAKRDHLRALGIEHVFDSRTTAFAADVLACTGGRGVDVVLNSLTGEAIRAGISVLAPRGRFVEIGKRDLDEHTRVDLAGLRRNVAFFVLDLAALTVEVPDVVGAQLADVVALVAAGRLAPLPTACGAVRRRARGVPHHGPGRAHRQARAHDGGRPRGRGRRRRAA